MVKISLTIIVLVFFLSGCAQTKKVRESVLNAPKKVAEAIPDKVSVKTGERKTYIQAISKPLYDINLIKHKIPEDLLNINSVYQRPEDCSKAKKEIMVLGNVLGEDTLDMLEQDKDGKEVDTLTLNIAKLASRGLSFNIPYASAVRRLSGASKYEKKRVAALFRGQARRAFLKGYLTSDECTNTYSTN